MSDEDQHSAAINRAFTAQSAHYDVDDLRNPILQAWRTQVYRHVADYLKPGSRLLELNAGTGIDAVHFARQGHHVLATDFSVGMIRQLQYKAESARLDNLQIRELSFLDLSTLKGEQFDYAFSNFGGLNCQLDLSVVTQDLRDLVRPEGYVTWVIMPPISLWEIAWALTGKWKMAFRRWTRNGTMAHLEGEYFKTYYHSLGKLRQAFGSDFFLVRVQSLGVFTPPPSSAAFVNRHPRVFAFLQSLERAAAGVFPFNRIGDHLVVTFQRKA